MMNSTQKIVFLSLVILTIASVFIVKNTLYSLYTNNQGMQCDCDLCQRNTQLIFNLTERLLKGSSVDKPGQLTKEYHRVASKPGRRNKMHRPTTERRPFIAEAEAGEELNPLDRMLLEDKKDGLFSSLDFTTERATATKGGLFDYLPQYESPCWESSYPIADGFPQIYKVGLRNDRWGVNGGAKSIREFSEFRANVESRVKSGNNWRLRCLPAVYLVGAEKCGTTDLVYQLHKNSALLRRAAYKEARYWTPARFKNASFSSYLDLFDRGAEEIYNTTTSTGGKGLMMDGTPYYLYQYLWHEIPGNEGLEAPKFILAHTLHKLNPKTKILIILRDPVDRSYSAWRHRHPRESPEVFHAYVSRAISRWNNCYNKTGDVRVCGYSVNEHRGFYRAIYYLFIKDWIDVFGRDQVKIIKSEDYYSNRVHILNEIYRFLGLELIPEANSGEIQDDDVRNMKKNPKAMRAETAVIMKNFFKKYNQRLANLLSDDKFLWNK